MNVTLKKHAQKAAIEAIEKELYNRDQGHLLVGQPLKLVSRPGYSSTSRKTNDSSKRAKASTDYHGSTSLQVPAHDATTALQPDSRASVNQDRGSATNKHSILPIDRLSPMVAPYKRLSSPGGVTESSPKKQKKDALSDCPVCFGPYHPLENCPVLHQDTHRSVFNWTRLKLFLTWALVSRNIFCGCPRTRLKSV